jgi:hypothetical protein
MGFDPVAERDQMEIEQKEMMDAMARGEVPTPPRPGQGGNDEEQPDGQEQDA